MEASMTDQGYAGAGPQAPVSLPEIRMVYRGEGGDLFFIVLKNVFLTLITLGIYSAWGKTARRAYMWKQVDIGGERLEYTGTGKELFVGYLKVALGYLVLFGIPAVVMKISKPVGSLLQLLGFLGLMIILPYAVYWSRRYLLSRTRWRGIRFGLAGSAGQFAKLWIGNWFLTIITLGIYAPIFANKVYGAIINNTRYGDASFSYDGRDGDAFKIGIKGFLLSLVTGGIYSFWYRAEMLRFRLSHIRFDRAVGTIDITGGLIFKLTMVNLLLNGLTLGLAFPWTATYTLKTVLERVRFLGAIDFARVGQRAVVGDPAGDGLAGALGVELGL